MRNRQRAIEDHQCRVKDTRSCGVFGRGVVGDLAKSEGLAIGDARTFIAKWAEVGEY